MYITVALHKTALSAQTFNVTLRADTEVLIIVDEKSELVAEVAVMLIVWSRSQKQNTA